MPVVSSIDRNSEEPIKKYVADAENYRLQLAALPDEVDPKTGRKVASGRNMVAQFRHSIFETNKPEMITEIEKSFAFENGNVRNYDDLVKEAKEKRYQDLLALAKDDEDMLERLKKDLVKRSTQAQKERAEELRAQVEAEVRPSKE